MTKSDSFNNLSHYKFLKNEEKEFINRTAQIFAETVAFDDYLKNDDCDFLMKNEHHLFLIAPALLELLITCPDFSTMSKTCSEIARVLCMSKHSKCKVNDILGDEICIVFSQTLQSNLENILFNETNSILNSASETDYDN